MNRNFSISSMSTSSAGTSTSEVWSISVSNAPDQRQIIWTGSIDSGPSIQELHSLFSVNMTDDMISDISGQVVRNAPLKVLPPLLSCLSCNYWRNKSSKIDIRMLNNIKDEKKSVCGAVFKNGEFPCLRII